MLPTRGAVPESEPSVTTGGLPLFYEAQDARIPATKNVVSRFAAMTQAESNVQTEAGILTKRPSPFFSCACGKADRALCQIDLRHAQIQQFRFPPA
jgi:hypothetical protein